MKNWLGQEIAPGCIVGRGARDGNTSSFKVGRVVKLLPEKRLVRVAWFWEAKHLGYGPNAVLDEFGNEIGFPRQPGFYPGFPEWGDGAIQYGSPNVDTLFLLAPETFGEEVPLDA
ncbi:hypothetical protein ACFRAQ_34655 [Nocardia sp. NPDC056611]|uniref:hypothetical protein n=1 Tax=Nocardia sp. NPDC056611 TaxID=3345877 RepID=UPI00366F5FD1